MLVKRYVVKEMPEAVAMIREDLGKDAVILSTKKIQSRGFLGLFAKTQIEVVAAANEQDKSQQPERIPVQGVPRTAAMGAYQQSKTQSQQQIATLEREDVVVPPVPPKAPERPAILQPQPVHPVPSVLPFTPPAVESKPKLEPQAAPPSEPQAEPRVVTKPAEQDGQLLQEVQELRQLLRTIVQAPERGLLPEAVMNVRQHLLSQEVQENFVDQLIERGILQINKVQSVNEQEFREILTNFIKEEFERVAKPSPLSPQTRIASLMGPTGVGKTTTIAKLAAEQVLTQGKKIGLITTDTYRIAAVEQLRTYANILNVPLEVCYSPEDIARAVEKFADRDLILVDTAGRNYGNMLNVRELNAYLEALQPDETYLVLSLTTKASDLEEIVRNFTQVRTDKFLFTKADETKTLGAVYNLVSRYGVPLSYLTYGQNVPDDIETLSTDKLASLLVGEKSDA
ncbi:MAG: flagellar biosynthesis protein FlhF [Tumebacillaceae bacterium]